MVRSKQKLEPKRVALTPAQKKFVLHWGEMGSRWGINRTEAQIHALLYILARPLTAEEIATTLGVARSNVSTSLRDLQGWGIVKASHQLGDRRDHFESLADVWEMARIIGEERKRRELDPTMALLRECVAEVGTADPSTRHRLGAMLELFEAAEAAYQVTRGVPTQELRRLVALRSRAQKVLRLALGR
jgi:DNA-binding transcriptional regulator GbsR (MarR family)